MEFKGQTITAEETLHGATQPEVNDAQNEFFRLDDEMRGMVKNMTIVQRQKVNEMIKQFMDAQSMNKI